MVVDVDQKVSVLDAFTDGAKPLKAGAVGCNYAIKMAPRLGRLEQMVGFQKAQLARERVLVPTDDLFILILQIIVTGFIVILINASNVL